jgi:hypothetical protein
MKLKLNAIAQIIVLAFPLSAEAQVSPLVAQLTNAWYDEHVMPVLRPYCPDGALGPYRTIVRLTVEMLQTSSMDKIQQMQQAAMQMKPYLTPQCQSAMQHVPQPPPPFPGSSGGQCMGNVCCTSSGCTH